MRHRDILAMLIALAVSPLSSAHAQQAGSTEFGIDGGIQGVFNGSVSQAIVVFPEQRFRVGFFMSDAVQVQPSISFALESTRVSQEPFDPFSGFDDKETETRYVFDASVDLVVHLASGDDRVLPFLQAGPLLIAVAEGTPRWQAGVAGGFGAKIPVAEAWAVRLAITGGHRFETDELRGISVVGFSVGVSFFSS